MGLRLFFFLVVIFVCFQGFLCTPSRVLTILNINRDHDWIQINRRCVLKNIHSCSVRVVVKPEQVLGTDPGRDTRSSQGKKQNNYD